MASDLIRKADVQKILKALYDNRQYSDVTSTLFVAMENIHDLPTVDAVEVVRCKDCKFNVANMAADSLDSTDYSDITCSYFMTDGMKADDFCSRSAKMDGGDKE